MRVVVAGAGLATLRGSGVAALRLQRKPPRCKPEQCTGTDIFSTLTRRPRREGFAALSGALATYSPKTSPELTTFPNVPPELASGHGYRVNVSKAK